MTTLGNHYANVYVPGSFKVESLTYTIPEGIKVDIGYCVLVPFGKKEIVGLVTAINVPAPKYESKSIIKSLYKSSSKELIECAESIAKSHFTGAQNVYRRLFNGDSEVSTQEDELEYADFTIPKEISIADTVESNYVALIKPPQIEFNSAVLWEISRQLDLGIDRILIICPTNKMVESLYKNFRSGVCILKKPSQKDHGYFEFLFGKKQVAITTRVGALWCGNIKASLILVDSNHPGHKEMNQPYTHAYEALRKRAELTNSNFSTISSIPPVFTIEKGTKVIELTSNSKWPESKVIYRSDFAPGERDIPESIQFLLREDSGFKQKTLIVASNTPTRILCNKCKSIRNVGNNLKMAYEIPCEVCGTKGGFRVGLDVPTCEKIFKDLIDANKVEITGAEGLEESKESRMVVLLDTDWAIKDKSMSGDSIISQLLLRGLSSVGKNGKLVVVTKNRDRIFTDILDQHLIKEQVKKSWHKAKDNNLSPFALIIKISSSKNPPVLPKDGGMQYGPRKTKNGYEQLINVKNNEIVQRYINNMLEKHYKLRIEKY